ncbi:hypothetical protein [Cupriavidus pampae]|uniref:Uncharacterized protein n=1 Tax=Cupriavidus pampae TaxID=659251 RepID=A0ABN7Z7H2_9BURK|nr:hypothetical protein [Cupriavidus pampae]CAG9180301.1 hypothetical protein LMG32289_04585 [Cupriavidus pampae]
MPFGIHHPVSTFSPVEDLGDQIARRLPGPLRGVARKLVRSYANEVYNSAGISIAKPVHVVQVPPPPQGRRLRKPPPQMTGQRFHPYAQGMAAFQPYQSPAPQPRQNPWQTRREETYDPPPAYVSDPARDPAHHPQPQFAPPPGPPPHWTPPTAPMSTFQRPPAPSYDTRPWHHQPPPVNDPIGAELHAQLNRIEGEYHATMREIEEERQFNQALANSMTEDYAPTDMRGIDPALIHDEQRTIASTLKVLRDIPFAAPDVPPWHTLPPEISSVYKDERAYLLEASAGATRTDRIHTVLTAEGMALVPNSGTTQMGDRDAKVSDETRWATNNCLLISLMQHATGDYDSQHAPLVNQFREILEQDPSLDIKPGDKLPAKGKIANSIMALINDTLGLERPLRMITVSDASGHVVTEATGSEAKNRRDVMVIDMGGHFEAAAPIEVIEARRRHMEPT